MGVIVSVSDVGMGTCRSYKSVHDTLSCERPTHFLENGMEATATRRVLMESGVVQERHTDRANALPCSTGQRATRMPPDLGSAGGYHQYINYWGCTGIGPIVGGGLWVF